MKKKPRLGLPSGEFDLPLVIQDRSFDSENQLVYAGGSDERLFWRPGAGQWAGPTHLESAGAAVPPAPAERLECPHLQAGLGGRPCRSP